jgi:hypothetical protein
MQCRSYCSVPNSGSGARAVVLLEKRRRGAATHPTGAPGISGRGSQGKLQRCDCYCSHLSSRRSRPPPLGFLRLDLGKCSLYSLPISRSLPIGRCLRLGTGKRVQDAQRRERPEIVEIIGHPPEQTPQPIRRHYVTDPARHQSSRRLNGTEAARRSRQWPAYAAAIAGDEIRFRSSEFTAAPRVQFIEPVRVTALSITIVLACAIRA